MTKANEQIEDRKVKLNVYLHEAEAKYAEMGLRIAEVKAELRGIDYCEAVIKNEKCGA